MSDINLLPKKEGVNLENDQAALILRRISLGILSLTVLTTVFLFVLVIQSPLSRTKQEENALLTKLGEFKIQISRSVIIDERLLAIASILRQRNHFEKYIQAILDTVPLSVSITSLEVDKKTIQMTGNSPSLSEVNAFLDSLVTIQKDKKLIASVFLESFSSDAKSGKYYFTVKITIL